MVQAWVGLSLVLYAATGPTATLGLRNVTGKAHDELLKKEVRYGLCVYRRRARGWLLYSGVMKGTDDLMLMILDDEMCVCIVHICILCIRHDNQEEV